MNKKDEISDQLYSKMRSTGGQRARLYGLTKLHKAETPLRPLLLPAARMRVLTKRLQSFFDNIDGAMYKPILKMPEKQLKIKL